MAGGAPPQCRTVHIGLMMFPTHYSVEPDELGRIVEEHGFESLFVPEHTHIPAARRTPYPAGGELPREYSHMYDPFVALGAIAAVTERLTLATGICLVVERDPVVTAKEVATIDRISGGRFLFGVGAGWNREEMETHGTDPRTRFALMRERVEAMKAIWTRDEAEYHGEFVDFDPLWSWPKPVQEPHPPVIVGGNGAGVIDRVLDYGDAWMPNAGFGTPADLIARIEELRRRGRESGRGEPPVTVYAARSKREVLDEFAEAGVERAVLYLPSESREELMPRIERQARLAEELRD
jgi:probable F420-dependent oxidoreductase